MVTLGYLQQPSSPQKGIQSPEQTFLKTVNIINQGKSHFAEPDLDLLVKSAILNGHLECSTLPKYADIYIICVPTPLRRSGKSQNPDIDSVLEATASISSFIKPVNLVILESTSPVGTTEEVEKF